MNDIKTQIQINATPEKIWRILTDFEKHPQWNPFLKSISGDKRKGGKLTVRIEPPEGKGMTFTPTILEFSDNQEFRWIGRLFVKGLFDGEHYFLLEDQNDGTTEFIHGEKFSGILVGLFGKVVENAEKGFLLMNEALKRECEK